MSSLAITSLRRIISDMHPFQDGRCIPSDLLDSFEMPLELVYRELLVQECVVGLNNEEAEACELVRRALALVKSMQECESNTVLERPPVRYTGRIGRPRFDIPCQQLKVLIESGFTGPQVAEMLGTSLSTVRRRMQEFGLFIGCQYSDMSDDELDSVVRSMQSEFLNCGNQQMQGHLQGRGYRVQQQRIREAQRRIDPVGSLMRCLWSINRRIVWLHHEVCGILMGTIN